MGKEGPWAGVATLSMARLSESRTSMGTIIFSLFLLKVVAHKNTYSDLLFCNKTRRQDWTSLKSSGNPFLQDMARAWETITWQTDNMAGQGMLWHIIF